MYFYGADGQKLVTYRVEASPFGLVYGSENVSFAGKAIRSDGSVVVRDRLGSVVWQGAVSKDYFPYGGEIGPATPGNVDKFGTYHRDQTTGLDYADQRYFAGLSGRFLTADGSGSNEALDTPASWKSFAYVEQDPVNFIDPTGESKCGDAEFNFGQGSRSVRSIMTGTSDFDLLAQIMWHEAGTMNRNDTYQTFRDEVLMIGTAMMNRFEMSAGNLSGYGIDGETYSYSFYGNTLGKVILQAGGNNYGWGVFTNGKLAGRALQDLNDALNIEIPDSAITADDIRRECYGVWNAIWGAAQVLNDGVRRNPAGGIVLSWNSSQNADNASAADIRLNPELANLGRSTKVGGNVFFGLLKQAPSNPVIIPRPALPKPMPRPRPVPVAR